MTVFSFFLPLGCSFQVIASSDDLEAATKQQILGI